MTNPISNKNYFPGLDFVRGLAIILVVLYHYFPFFKIGWIGVDLFFVLSGFLITTKLLECRNEDNFFQNFYLRRILRLFPIYFLALIAFYTLSPVFFSDKQNGSVFDFYNQNWVWFFTFTQNFLFIKKGPAPEPYLMHFWSLAIEEQFYLLWPFLVYFCRRESLFKCILISIFFSALFFRIYSHQTSQSFAPYYFHLVARADSLAAGAFLAILQMSKKEINKFWGVGILLFFIAIFLSALVKFKNVDFDNPYLLTVGYSITCMFFTLVCYRAIKHPMMSKKYLVVKYLGKISYGIYVYHLPIFLAGNYLLKNFIFQIGVFQFFSNLLLLVITIVVSSLSYRFIELPFIKLKGKS